MYQSLEILNIFNTVTLKQIFWKTQALFKKLEYRFQVERTKIDNATFPYKTTQSEANIKTNIMGSTKCTYRKQRSFASIYLLFPKILFQFRNPVSKVDLRYQLTKYPYLCFSKALEFYLRGFFSLWISLIKEVKWILKLFVTACNCHSLMIISTALRCESFSKKTSKKTHLCRPDKNYYYFCKSNIPAINLIVSSRNMIKVSKNMSL